MTLPQTTVLAGPWRKSSFCDTGGQCVEVAQAGASWLIRDSKNPTGACLAFSARAWAAFIGDIRQGACGA
jgi:hypothetical protein